MEYKGYEVYEDGNRIIVRNIKDFNPVHTFECGQCFRWVREADGSYTGVVRDKVVNIRCANGGKELVIGNCSAEDFVNLWYHYFDLGRDYSRIKSMLSRKDGIMKKAVEFGEGIRLLRQDLWEVLISFIISANNRIPMIMKVIAILSETYGNKIMLGDKCYYTFPGIDRLAGENIDALKVCRGGFRCKYILETSRMIKDGEIDLNVLYKVGTGEAREILKKFPGVGSKVADCILLYSGIKYDVFPTDVWVKRVMEELYFQRTASFKEIQEFATTYFNGYAGFAQQYLFYYARENKIGKDRNEQGR
ncbi:MAG: 8-oxoguanine DNA glycosylase [Clostridiaceae bacterium]|nr:8-oxoguanine DNA glycosylase [Clostridiaceae bacterium]